MSEESKSRTFVPLGILVICLAWLMYSDYRFEKSILPVPPSELSHITDPCVRNQVNDWLAVENAQVVSVYAFKNFKRRCTPEAKQANLPEKLKFTEQLNAMKRSEP